MTRDAWHRVMITEWAPHPDGPQEREYELFHPEECYAESNGERVLICETGTYFDDTGFNHDLDDLPVGNHLVRAWSSWDSYYQESDGGVEVKDYDVSVH